MVDNRVHQPVTEESMHETKNDLPERARKTVAELLNERLADAIDLGTQTKHAHWNVKDPNFIALHRQVPVVPGSALAG